MTISIEQRHAAICEIAIAIAKYEGWEASKEAVALALASGSTTNSRTERWINLAAICFDVAQEAIAHTQYQTPND